MDAECILGVWDAAGGGAVIQVIGAYFIIHTHRLDRGGVESATGAGKLGVNGKDIGERICG